MHFFTQFYLKLYGHHTHQLKMDSTMLLINLLIGFLTSKNIILMLVSACLVCLTIPNALFSHQVIFTMLFR